MMQHLVPEEEPDVHVALDEAAHVIGDFASSH